MNCVWKANWGHASQHSSLLLSLNCTLLSAAQSSTSIKRLNDGLEVLKHNWWKGLFSWHLWLLIHWWIMRLASSVVTLPLTVRDPARPVINNQAEKSFFMLLAQLTAIHTAVTYYCARECLMFVSLFLFCSISLKTRVEWLRIKMLLPHYLWRS